MKQLLSLILLLSASCTLQAQVRLAEPEYIGQVLMLTSDTTAQELTRENVRQQVKSTHFGAIPLPGTSLLDKTRMSSVIAGPHAPHSFSAGVHRFLIRTDSSDQDPQMLIAIWKMTVKKKNREHKTGEVGILTGASMNVTGSDIPFQAQKYGEHSCLVTLPEMEPGEYAITFPGQPQVSTFTIR